MLSGVTVPRQTACWDPSKASPPSGPELAPHSFRFPTPSWWHGLSPPQPSVKRNICEGIGLCLLSSLSFIFYSTSVRAWRIFWYEQNCFANTTIQEKPSTQFSIKLSFFLMINVTSLLFGLSVCRKHTAALSFKLIQTLTNCGTLGESIASSSLFSSSIKRRKMVTAIQCCCEDSKGS